VVDGRQFPVVGSGEWSSVGAILLCVEPATPDALCGVVNWAHRCHPNNDTLARYNDEGDDDGGTSNRNRFVRKALKR